VSQRSILGAAARVGVVEADEPSGRVELRDPPKKRRMLYPQRGIEAPVLIGVALEVIDGEGREPRAALGDRAMSSQHRYQ